MVLSVEGVVHYATNLILYIETLREKYSKMYKKFINQLQMYANVIRVLSNDYLPISLLPPVRVKEILDEVKTTIQITNPDYDIIVKRLYMCYDMKVPTSSINEERNSIVQFPILIQPYIQQQLILYHIEMVKVSIIDLNKKAHSYTHLQVDIPYMALNSEHIFH